GSRVWDGSTFDASNHLQDKKPIAEPTLLMTRFDGNTPVLVEALGGNQFYLPHGVFVDVDGYIYTTDVGAHTVTKWKKNGKKLDLVWRFGEEFVPGSDHGHLCKPTGVTKNGDRIFISDGYCNARVVELTADGKYKAQFGARVQAKGNSSYRTILSFHRRKPFLSLIDKTEEYRNSTWKALFNQVSPDGNHIFIGDISEKGATLWKFRIQHDSSTESHTLSGATYYEKASAAYGAIKNKASTAPLTLTFFLLLGVVAGGIYVWMKKGRRRANPQNAFDRKGFKRLKSERTRSSFLHKG
ncbi:unnamed protein product, partial [Mesorhabditis belari]